MGRRKHVWIGSMRILQPRCILCNQLYGRTWLSIFDDHFLVPIRTRCIVGRGEIERCEERMLEVFASEPAFDFEKVKSE
jgi:hypothetical protein